MRNRHLPENRYDIESARNPRYDKTRYHGLNLHSYWYRNTIEFRYHSAVLYAIDEAMQWIIFTQFLIELSRGHVPEVHFHSEANKWLQMIYKIYEEFGYQDRLKKMAY
ncbi:MAG: amidoligase family protein [Deltaproteobacteria bacterium]|nr:amidoligase family protein [Deltaproteobacteria bacterium]